MRLSDRVSRPISPMTSFGGMGLPVQWGVSEAVRRDLNLPNLGIQAPCELRDALG